MKYLRDITLMAAVGFCCLCGTSTAQEGPGGDMKELRGEVKALRTQLQALDKKLDRVLTELAAVKKGQGSAAKGKRQPDTTVYKVNVGSSPYKGAADAPVTIVEFSDFQCPYCIREWPKLKKVLDDYPNQVRVVYKHFPLSFHKKAPPAQAASILAQQQLGNDGFWKMHDLISANAKKLDIPTLRTHAESLGLDMGTFDAVMADKAKIDALLKDDMAEARKCKVRGTPTILINGLKLADRSAGGYKTRIDQILKEKGIKKAG